MRKNMVRWLLGAALALPLGLYAQEIDENAMKAAFVYNFALFTDWPADAQRDGGEINLCVEPGSPMTFHLDALNGKHVKGRRLVVRKINMLQASLSSCHILFVGRENRREWPLTRKRIDNASVLTVSDDSDINADGVIIALSVQNRRVVFDIDQSAARRARLSMSSKLLRLARTVK